MWPKKARLGINPNVEVQQVFNQYVGCAKGSQEWDTEKVNGEKHVVFSCDDFAFTKSAEIVKSWVNEKKVNTKVLDVKKTNFKVYFVIHKDDTVTITQVKREIAWKDGKKRDIFYTGGGVVSQIKPMYDNELNELAQVVDRVMNPFTQGRAIQMVSGVFTELYNTAK